MRGAVSSIGNVPLQSLLGISRFAAASRHEDAGL